MGRIPSLLLDKNVNEDPHVVIIGAGASRASFLQGDKYGRKLPLMCDFIEKLGLESLLSRRGIKYVGKNFEELYDDLYRQPSRQDLLSEIEAIIFSYFEQMQLPDQSTFYDELLLSLRAKDLIATFNWDPLLWQACQRNSEIKELPKVVFLHGNVAVGVCIKDKIKSQFGYRCNKCGEPFERSPLLFPIREKNYKQNPYIESEWRMLEDRLRYAFMLTIFGYSAPTTDVNAIELMKQAWALNGAREMAQIEIIDIKNKRQLLNSWREFITRSHYAIWRRWRHSLIRRYPRRSCEAIAWAVLQQDPWHEKPLPKFRVLQRLQDWVQPLVTQEIAYRDYGTPLQRV